MIPIAGQPFFFVSFLVLYDLVQQKIFQPLIPSSTAFFMRPGRDDESLRDIIRVLLQKKTASLTLTEHLSVSLDDSHRRKHDTRKNPQGYRGEGSLKGGNRGSFASILRRLGSSRPLGALWQQTSPSQEGERCSQHEPARFADSRSPVFRSSFPCTYAFYFNLLGG